MSMMTRKAFLKQLGLVTLAAGTASLMACSDDGSANVDAGPDGPSGCTATNAAAMIATNHVHSPHALVVSSADVTAGAEKTYDIMGTATHTHAITVTAAQFVMLQGGGTIMVTSTDGIGHTHVVTVSC